MLHKTNKILILLLIFLVGSKQLIFYVGIIIFYVTHAFVGINFKLVIADSTCHG